MKLISIDSEIRLEGHNNKQRQIDLKDEMLKKLDHLIYELLDYFEKKFEVIFMDNIFNNRIYYFIYKKVRMQ